MKLLRSCKIARKGQGKERKERERNDWGGGTKRRREGKGKIDLRMDVRILLSEGEWIKD